MIQRLDKTTINKIAAGEVVERPMAVVKELVENAIDAGANAVTVEIKEGGISFIRITDNGSGIKKDEIPVAFLRHATSKIRCIEDLLTVQSLGFRGEALASIAAVSQVELITKTHDELCGHHYEIHGGEEKSFDEIGCPDGTTIICRNLFYNTPARRKFLKTKMTEGGYINDVMERFALSHPEIRFTFIMDGRTKIQTSGNGQTKNNIYYIYGGDIAKAVTEVNFERNGMKVSGFVGKPEVSRGNRAYMNYFINGRYIKSPVISRAIEDAFSPYTMTHRYPFTVLFVEMNSEKLDVNVHPTKMEVRFEEPDEVYKLVNEGVSEAVRQASIIPQVSLSPSPKEKKTEHVLPDIERAEPFEKARLEEKNYEAKIYETSEKEAMKAEVLKEQTPFRFEQQNIELNSLTEKERKVDFRIIGQVFATYWLIQYQEELLIIDQHAAHEKVLYEKLVRSLENEQIYSQNLLVPIIVSLSVREEEILKENQGILEKIGFVIEPFGGKEYAIKAVPSDFLHLSVKDLFISLLDELMEKGKPSMEMVLEKCASMACKAAVKGNQSLSYREAEELIGQMLLLDNPYHCPHGRPTTISMTKQEFEKKFKRIV